MTSPRYTVTAILAEESELVFMLSGVQQHQTVSVFETSPWMGRGDDPQPGHPPVFVGTADIWNSQAVLRCPRRDAAHDRIYSSFRVTVNGEQTDGVCWVTDLGSVAAYEQPYPHTDTIKGLQVAWLEDALKLGVKHAAINLNQGDIMMPGPGEDIVPFVSDGQTFWFDEAYMRRFDETIKTLSDAGMVVSLILLNSPNWRRPMHDAMRDILLHPGYDPEGLISAFNLTNEIGYRHYRAFVEYTAQRYSRPDEAHGKVWGYIIGNEIDSQWVWGNAGRMPVEQYMKEYGLAMRTAWVAARQQQREARVYISLTHLFNISHLPDPLQTYPGRRCLELLADDTNREGPWDWGVAFHPYPEDLRFPDFWNDEHAVDSLDTPRITFKNIHVLPRFLKQDQFLYNGQCRHIILSEQGFNSLKTDESEAFQAAAYALAWERIVACPEIEAFILHAHVDNLHEFGLNLGIWRCDENGKPSSPKPIYEVFRDIDGPRGPELIEAARPFLQRRMKRQEEERLY